MDRGPSRGLGRGLGRGKILKESSLSGGGDAASQVRWFPWVCIHNLI